MVQEPEDLAARMAAMATELQQQRTVRATMDVLVGWAVNLVPGCDHAGILTTDREGTITTAAATDDLVRQSDRLQGELREGPCFDALWEYATFEIPDTVHDDRWSRFSPRVAELGIGSMLGFQLRGSDEAIGALDLHGTQPRAFDDRARQIGSVLAAHAGVALAWARTEQQLHEAVESRQTIGEAIGILRERHGLTSRQAFEALRLRSQQSNTKLHTVAARLTETGENPL